MMAVSYNIAKYVGIIGNVGLCGMLHYRGRECWINRVFWIKEVLDHGGFLHFIFSQTNMYILSIVIPLNHNT